MEARVAVPERVNLPRAMWYGTIPYDDDGIGKLLEKVFQKSSHQVTIDIGVGMKTEEKTKATSARVYAEGCNDGYLLVETSLMIQPRSLPAGTPGPADERRHHDATFVDEDQPGFQPGRFFLMRGHSTLTHCLIFSSSRSTARRSGFWGLHPSAWRRRPIWST
jgi:hypothetical protein